MAEEPVKDFKHGDIVTIGKDGFVHWAVIGYSMQKGYVLLESGMTGRERTEHVNNLKHWK